MSRLSPFVSSLQEIYYFVARCIWVTSWVCILSASWSAFEPLCMRCLYQGPDYVSSCVRQRAGALADSAASFMSVCHPMPGLQWPIAVNSVSLSATAALRTYTLQGPLACAAPVGGSRELVGRSGRKWKTGNAGRDATNTEGRLKLMTQIFFFFKQAGFLLPVSVWQWARIISLKAATPKIFAWSRNFMSGCRIRFSAEVRILWNSQFKIGNWGFYHSFPQHLVHMFKKKSHHTCTLYSHLCNNICVVLD